MAKTPSDYMKIVVGEYVAQIAILQSQIEILQEQNDDLKGMIAALEKVQVKTEKEDK